MNYEKIKSYCEDQRLSIPDLAKQIGMTKSGLYLAISKRSLTVEKLEEISKVLKVPIWFFFDLDPELPYIQEIEREKNRNSIAEKTLEQMTKVIDQLKSRNSLMNMAIVLLTTQGTMLSRGSISIKDYEDILNMMVKIINNNYETTNSDYAAMLNELERINLNMGKAPK